MQRWENLGHKLDCNHWQLNKVFWKNTRRLRGKISIAGRCIKDRDGVLLSNERTSEMARVFKN